MRSLVITAAVVLALVPACGKDKDEGDPGAKVRGRAQAAVEHARLLQIVESATMWAVKNPGSSCPASLAELKDYAGADVTDDAWGNPRKLLCGADRPAGVHDTFAAQSAGPDGRLDTDDDVKSWE